MLFCASPPARIQASDSSVYHKLLFTLKLDRWAKPLLGLACSDAVESRRKLSTSSGPKAVRIGTHQKRGPRVWRTLRLCLGVRQRSAALSPCANLGEFSKQRQEICKTIFSLIPSSIRAWILSVPWIPRAALILFWIRRGDNLPARRRRRLFPGRPCLRPA